MGANYYGPFKIQGDIPYHRLLCKHMTVKSFPSECRQTLLLIFEIMFKLFFCLPAQT